MWLVALKKHTKVCKKRALFREGKKRDPDYLGLHAACGWDCCGAAVGVGAGAAATAEQRPRHARKAAY